MPHHSRGAKHFARQRMYQPRSTVEAVTRSDGHGTHGLIHHFRDEWVVLRVSQCVKMPAQVYRTRSSTVARNAVLCVCCLFSYRSTKFSRPPLACFSCRLQVSMNQAHYTIAGCAAARTVTASRRPIRFWAPLAFPGVALFTDKYHFCFNDGFECEYLRPLLVQSADCTTNVICTNG